MTADTAFDRRRFDRFVLQPMYTSVMVQRTNNRMILPLEGHAYDVSESGVRIELDEALEVGEEVAVSVDLPGGYGGINIFAHARVVWLYDDQDDPGPRRAALHFTSMSPENRERLHRYLGSGLARRAA